MANDAPEAAATGTTGKGSGSSIAKRIISEEPFSTTVERALGITVPEGLVSVAFSGDRLL
jgi:hypothetical protein